MKEGGRSPPAFFPSINCCLDPDLGDATAIGCLPKIWA